jgi:hypothetical protein
MEPSDYEKDRLSAMAKYADSVYQLETIRGNGNFYVNLMNIFLLLIALILLHNLGLFTPFMLYVSLFIVSVFGAVYVIGNIYYNTYFRDRSVYHQQLYNR